MGVREGLIYTEDREVGDRNVTWVPDDPSLTFAAGVRAYSQGLPVDGVAHIGLMLPSLCTNGFNYVDDAPTCSIADAAAMALLIPRLVTKPQEPVPDMVGSEATSVANVGDEVLAWMFDPDVQV
jgi:hypothetical protein